MFITAILGCSANSDAETYKAVMLVCIGIIVIVVYEMYDRLYITCLSL